MSKELFYIGKNHRLCTYFADYATDNNCKLIPYENLATLKAHKEPVLLLFEPYFDKKWNRYFSLARVWRRFALNELKPLKLLIVGDAPSKHPACINILDLSNLDLEKRLENLNTIGEMGEIEYPNPIPGNIDEEAIIELLKLEAIDPWDKQLPTQKSDLLKLLIQFFDGHANQGLRIQLNKLRQTFKSAYNKYSEIVDNCANDTEEVRKLKTEDCFKSICDNLIDKYGKEEWCSFYERWTRYYPLFYYTPFFEKIEAINSQLKPLNEAMQKFSDYQFDFEIEEFHNQLRTIHKRLNVIEKILRLSP